MAAFNLNSPELKQRLAETIAWCNPHAMDHVDTGDVRQYLHVFRQASELMNQAYREAQQPWNRLLKRDYQKSKKYVRGATLLQDANPVSAISVIGQLRSASLKPSPSLTEASGEAARKAAVEFVVDRRARLIAEKDRDAIETAPGLAGGKFLLYWPEENLADGAAEAATRGFFDVDNTPPWDTWISFSASTLLSWVPPQLCDLVQAGIDVNPEACIKWLR